MLQLKCLVMINSASFWGLHIWLTHNNIWSFDALPPPNTQVYQFKDPYVYLLIGIMLYCKTPVDIFLLFNLHVSCNFTNKLHLPMIFLFWINWSKHCSLKAVSMSDLFTLLAVRWLQHISRSMNLCKNILAYLTQLLGSQKA